MKLEDQIKKILSGDIYNALTIELDEARSKAALLTKEYNESYGKSMEERESLLRGLFKSVGQGVHFEPTLHCEFGANISIGNNFFGNIDCILLDGGEIEIGDNVLFGPRVGIYTNRHAYNAEERAAGACFSKKVTIGNSVWIGAGVHIDQGVTIGDNAIIGAGSIVTRDIPPNVIAVGAPCKVIRLITETDSTDYFNMLRHEY